VTQRHSAAFGFLLGALTVGVVWWQSASIVGPQTRPTRVEGEPMMVITPTAQEEPSPVAAPTVPVAVAPPSLEADPVADLRQRNLEMPVLGSQREGLHQSFADARSGSRKHEAIDILAPTGTPVVAVEDGTVAKLFLSEAGGITAYIFDPTSTYCYYYAHLDRYAAGLKDGARVRRGQVLGHVGATGNAPRDTPHLHFAIFKLSDSKRWWEGSPIDPFQVLK
jgi:murein DD-endopeptidase MepM/ murein hydrolase activator NlpD